MEIVEAAEAVEMMERLTVRVVQVAEWENCPVWAGLGLVAWVDIVGSLVFLSVVKYKFLGCL